MRQGDSAAIGRRDFLTGVMPACAVGCMGICIPPALLAVGEGRAHCQQKHKFDEAYPPLTLREYFSRVLGPGCELLKAFEHEIGEEELLRILRTYSFNRGKDRGQAVAARYPERDFFSYNERFRSGEMQVAITYDIVEDTEEAFEIAVTECVLVGPVLENDLGKIGNAWLCHADYGHAQGYNPRIELIRDKTLMLGHSCCNHRYVWTD